MNQNDGRDEEPTTSANVWHRDLWLNAMWDSESVKPNERVVAYVYARYAGARDSAWCAWDELKRRTGIRSRDAISRAISGLVDTGWLKEAERARQHYSVVYQLTIPVQQSVSRTAQESVSQTAEVQQSVSRTPEQSVSRTADQPSSPFPDTSSPSPETSSPFRGPHLSNNHSDHHSERDLSSSAAPDRDAQFKEWYAAYPRHKAPDAARKAWDKAIKQGASPEELLAGAKRFALERQGQDPKFTPYPASWLNAGGWKDEPERPPLRAVSGGHQPYRNPTDQDEYLQGI
jgi:hypothetical protein